MRQSQWAQNKKAPMITASSTGARTSGSESAHGPSDARRYEYLSTYILGGLRELNLEFSTA
jgi:hypothetical protein